MNRDETVYRAADELHRALVEVVETAPDGTFEDCFWEFEDEDWARDAILSAASWARWRETGAHNFVALAAGLDPGRAIADEMSTAMRYLTTPPAYDYLEGWTIPADVKERGRKAQLAYAVLRHEEPDRLDRRTDPRSERNV